MSQDSFLANKKHSIHFYHLLQVEHDLQKSFEECLYPKNTIIEDILVAVAVWIKDSEMSEDTKLSVQDIIALIVNILEEYNYKDVVQKFQRKSGFSILSKEELYIRLNSVIKSSKIRANVATKSRVYQQLKKLGYQVNKVSEDLIRQITLQELNFSKGNKDVNGLALENLPDWAKCYSYGHIFSSLRLQIDISNIFENSDNSMLILDFFVINKLIESFEQLQERLILADDFIAEKHYFSLVINKIPVFLSKKDVLYYLEEKLYNKISKRVLIKTSFQ